MDSRCRHRGKPTLPDAPIELYDLQVDENETKDVAAANPDVVRRIAELMRTSRTPAVLPKWNFTRRAR